MYVHWCELFSLSFLPHSPSLLSPLDVLFGFLGFEFPQHIAFSCPSGVAFDALFHLGDLLLEMARSVHKLIVLLPQELIETMEKEELHWEPTSEWYF